MSEDQYIWYLCFNKNKYSNFTCVPYSTQNGANCLARSLDEDVDTRLIPVHKYIPHAIHNRLLHNKLTKYSRVKILDEELFNNLTDSNR